MVRGSESSDGGRARAVLPIVFVTLLIDLIGFSIVFPLFPSMLTHYLAREGTSGLLGAMVDVLEGFRRATGSGALGIAVLFGGVLGSLYSLLQFVCAPLLGALSDRYGRRPVLIVSVAGIALSYLLWIFAHSFALLVLSRLIGGIMSGNISTATAVVADVTGEDTRSRGMALIGIAFGLGFILGPVIGGLSAGINLLDRWPELAAFGINPFSVPAAIATALALGNLLWVVFLFPETRALREATAPGVRRTINPRNLFRTESYPGVTRTNLANFLFLSAFSGTEFALTFLAADRLGYGPKGNAYMLLYVGLVLVLIQGGYVQRRAVAVGAKRMSMQGFLTAIPGLVLVGYAQTPGLLYLGLFLMAAGSAQVIPCLTALASLYAPAHEQGRILGVFRSLGALARAIGPLLACVLYWRLGSAATYYLVAAAMAVPLWIAQSLPRPEGDGARA